MAEKYKTGSAQKAAKDIQSDREKKKEALDRIMKEMQSSTVGSK